MRVPWTVRRSNQSILKEISPGISLEGMMLKLKLQHFGHLMRRVDSLEKTLMLRGIDPELLNLPYPTPASPPAHTLLQCRLLPLVRRTILC